MSEGVLNSIWKVYKDIIRDELVADTLFGRSDSGAPMMLRYESR